ncbi:Hypothetical predicted protein [Pelobates cultripes]|uniref:Sec16 Sec23-binding domain-containing protein n=1 Tax=Pelobates cultripes TaxID=61616 RepID=A0AAD1SYI7_PELCU|nr:Hypothetical predicted protein [Pelobates cultripes]
MDHASNPWFNQPRGRPTSEMHPWRGVYPQRAPYPYMNSSYGYFQNSHPRGGHHPWPPDPWNDYYSHHPANTQRPRDWGRPASRTEIYSRDDKFAFRPQSSQGYYERYGFYEPAPRESYAYEHPPAGEQEWSRRVPPTHTEQWVLNSYSGYHKNQTTETDRNQPQTSAQSWSQDYDDSVDKLQSFSLAEPSLLSQYRDSGMSSSSYELSQYMHDPCDRSDSWHHVLGEESSVCTPQPTAPMKFSLPHVSVCFGARGQLVRVCPNFPDEGQPALVEIHSIEVLLHTTVEHEEMRRFPGPVQREDLHKMDIINFCQENVSQCHQSQRPGSSADALLWQILLQMCRQNGCIAGSDVAELLLKDCKRDTYRIEHPNTNLISLIEDPLLISDCVQMDLLTGETQSAAEIAAQAVEKFTKLMFYGRKKEALDLAMKNKLWGHALFLSSKLDPRTYSWVMGRFTSTLAQNDPLLTLFQLMSGRIPQAATCSGDSKWGDWRPHLAVILSNQMVDSDINRRAVIAMGDNLVLKGLTVAGHCCYLAAAIPFGYYGKSDRLVLLGSNHNQAFQKFANSLNIQCTEILEYCQSLGKPSHCIPAFQVYKLLYATRLLDYGMTSLALHYCECIANSVLTHSGSAVLISELIKLAERLKYSDPRILDRPEPEQELEPKWLTQLKSLQWQVKGDKGKKSEGDEELTENTGKVHVNSDESRSSPAPCDVQNKVTGFIEPDPVSEEHCEPQTADGLSEPQNSSDGIGHCSIWTPRPQTMYPSIPQNMENSLHTMPPLTTNNEYTSGYNTYIEPQVPDVTMADNSLPQSAFISANNPSLQPPLTSRRVRTISETSTVSVDEDDDDEERTQENEPQREPHEQKKGSTFGWFGWFRSKPAKDVAKPSESTDPTPQKDKLPPPPPSAVSFPPMSQVTSDIPPKNQTNTFFTNTGFKEIEDPLNNNSSSVLSDIQGQTENMVTHAGLTVPGVQTSSPGGNVPLYNPSQFSETGRITNRPSRPPRGRYPLRP